MDWLLKRLKEPTTWLGLAAVAQGAGQLGQINEAPAVVDTLTNVGGAVASGADPISIGVLLIGGILGAFMKEKAH